DPAGIPWSSAAAAAPVEFESEHSFPVINYLSASVGAPYLAAKDGCEKVLAIAVELPSIELSKELANLGYHAAGGQGDIPWITYPATTTDWAPVAQQITDFNPDCLLPYSSETINSV